MTSVEAKSSSEVAKQKLLVDYLINKKRVSFSFHSYGIMNKLQVSYYFLKQADNANLLMPVIFF
jgi:hypothetical protein